MTETPAGPRRWERAAKNAANHPMSRGGKLYAKRTAIADAVAKALPLAEGPFDFLHYLHRDETPSVEWRTCSLRCTAMELQLFTSDAFTEEQYIDIFKSLTSGGPSWRPPPRHTLVFEPRLRLHDRSAQSRPVRCHVCAATIRPDGQVRPAKEGVVNGEEAALRRLLAQANAKIAELQAAAVQPRPAVDLSDLWYIDAYGQLSLVANMTVVHIESNTAALAILIDYCEKQGRMNYVRDYGRTLGELAA